MPSEPVLRLAVFLGVFAMMAVWEVFAPKRAAPRVRWVGNLGVAVVNTVLVRLLFPLGAVGAAMAAEVSVWGVLRGAPGWLAWGVSVLALYLVIYGQHVVFHRVPWLWRLHRMHHADTALDVSSGLRFHPGEILISMGIKAAAVVALGAPAGAVVLFEVLLNASSMFNHANVALPGWADRALRMLVVTPDMHRVHHSADARETETNFGFNLVWWDRLFGTYRAQPRLGHAGMVVGLEGFRSADEGRLGRMLTQPFRGG
jgi:sterol desaturase/sphingolipid hydroxylase (fatty acid hydroxylase superfamily)